MSRDTLTFRYNLWLPLLSLFCIKISSDWFFLNSKHALGVLLSDESSSEGGLGDQSEGDVQSVQVHSIPCHGKSGEVINWQETKKLKTFAILLWQGMECPYSKDSSGCVPAEEIKLRECLVNTKINMSPFDRFVLMHLPGKITYKEIDEMIRTVDKNEDGKISYSEFRVKMEIDKITVIQFKQEKMKGRFHSFLVPKATLEPGHDQWVCKLYFSISYS